MCEKSKSTTSSYYEIALLVLDFDYHQLSPINVIWSDIELFSFKSIDDHHINPDKNTKRSSGGRLTKHSVPYQKYYVLDILYMLEKYLLALWTKVGN